MQRLNAACLALQSSHQHRNPEWSDIARSWLAVLYDLVTKAFVESFAFLTVITLNQALMGMSSHLSLPISERVVERSTIY